MQIFKLLSKYRTDSKNTLITEINWIHCNYYNVCEKNMPEMSYVINLNTSIAKWHNANKQLDPTGLRYQKFNAAHGYAIKITNIQTNTTFFGMDIKDHAAKIESDTLYKLSCNPGDNNPVEMKYISDGGLSAGELGVWCSNKMIWEDAHTHNYSKIIVFEDDFVIRQGFKKKLHAFINHIPNTFDLAYLNDRGGKGVFHLPNNSLIKGFEDYYANSNIVAVMYSQQGIRKLLSVDHYFDVIDYFFWCLTTGTTNGHSYKECSSYKGYLEAYASYDGLIGVTNIASDIAMMGRGE